MIYKEFNTRTLLGIAMMWARKNDNILYANLDYSFGSYELGLDLNDKELMKKVKYTLENNKIEDILKESIYRSDYDDATSLYMTFQASHRNWNPGDIYNWKYDSFKENNYSFMNELIDNKRNELRKTGYDNWHKSKDHIKHNNFRYWINRLKEGKEEEILSLRLFVENDTKCFDTFRLCNNYHQKNVFNSIMEYILDNDICPDKHYKELKVPDFVAKHSMYNTRKITSSGEFGGFYYLVYLTAEELQDIYKNKINKRKISELNKPIWAYINSLRSDYAKKTKFYLHIK